MTVAPLPPLSSPIAPFTSDAPATPFEPDAPLQQNGAAANEFQNALWSAMNDASSAFQRAANAEASFLHGRGGLQELVLERAQADVVLAIATSAASRATQSLSTIVNMQV